MVFMMLQDGLKRQSYLLYRAGNDPIWEIQPCYNIKDNLWKYEKKI
jgi:hypothetical protein